jgi:hypothetical protein
VRSGWVPRLPLRAVVAVPTVTLGLSALAGCAASGGGTAPLPVTVISTPKPGPTITTIRNAESLPAGRTATVSAQPGVSLRLTASTPRLSRTRLSSSYGHPPAHGYYVSFTITVRNTGSRAVDLGPLNFYVRIAGQGDVTSYMGNAPYSGASSQLDNTEIEAGQTVQGPLTFDVRRPHGVLAFAPDKSAAVTWRF